MRLALISYEYPPDTACGGIATYTDQVARMLQQRGHHVEVFTSSPSREGSSLEAGVLVHRFRHTNPSDRRDFALQIAPVFTARHALVDFDLVEGPEHDAPAWAVIAQVPDLPLVVKLHTPTFMVADLGYVAPTPALRLRRCLGALRRGQLPQPFVRQPYNPDQDLERLHTLAADVITTPSQALGEKLKLTWGLPGDRLIHLPNPYIPAPALLEIPIATHTQTVTFLGRLEVRKGILDLARAIPLILRRHPQVKFRFVGAVCSLPNHPLNTQQYLTRMLWRQWRSLEFTGSVPLDQIPEMLVQTDICVIPSRWENFPNVCLEAMAAGRGVVGSWAGGMAEMLAANQAGCLVPPQAPDAIAAAVIELLDHPERRMQLGQAARDRVLSTYNLDQIGALQEESYLRAIAHRRSLGPRSGAEINLLR